MYFPGYTIDYILNTCIFPGIPLIILLFFHLMCYVIDAGVSVIIPILWVCLL